MSTEAPYLLWICSWYPNALEPLTGDFLQRHARAVAQQIPVHVWAFVHDAKGQITTSVSVEKRFIENVRETVVYFHIPPSGIRLIDKWRMLQKMHQLVKMQSRQQEQEFGKPLLIHAHIAVYAALLAHKLANHWQLPFFISEQWTEYLKEATPNFQQANAFVRFKWLQAMRAAKGISAVSVYLAERLKELSGKNVVRIQNVVDTAIFNPSLISSQANQLIHVSTFSPQKQPEFIIEAFAEVVHQYPEGVLVMVGPERKDLKELAQQLGCIHRIIWRVEMPQSELVHEIARSKALILYSAFETFGCVVIEALAVGVPVIGSDIPPMKELLLQPEQGWIVANRNTNALAAAMLSAFNTELSAFRHQLSDKTTTEFSYKNVAQAFIDFYGMNITPSTSDK